MIANINNPINAVLGGTIMSIASTLHLLIKGKITGISGAIFRCTKREDFHYNLPFLLGMIFISTLNKSFNLNSKVAFESDEYYSKGLSPIGFIISGYLVGLGTKIANGCTSGHGVCGLPRLSKRSIVAVITFCAFGIAFATLRYYVPFLETDFLTQLFNGLNFKLINFSAFIASIVVFVYDLIYLYSKKRMEEFRDSFIAFGAGLLFGFGLLQSGMVSRHKVVYFLSIGFDWDMTLLLVLGSAVGLNFITFNLILKKMNKPLLHNSFQLPYNADVDGKLIIGAAIFGVGWGFGGICPGPGIMTCFTYFPQCTLFLAALIFGQWCGYWSDDFLNKHFAKHRTIKSDILPFELGDKIS